MFIYRIEDIEMVAVIIAPDEEMAASYAYDEYATKAEYDIQKLGVVTVDVFHDIKPGVVCISDG